MTGSDRSRLSNPVNAASFRGTETCSVASSNSRRTSPQQFANDAVIDGELVCVDQSGRTIFNDLLFHRGECWFFAFDLLWLNAQDLRDLPLIERKRSLKRLIGRRRSRVHYVDHIEAKGCAMFGEACRIDLEGIVAKPKVSLYRADVKRSSWVKIKNRTYSQLEGRHELFEEMAAGSRG